MRGATTRLACITTVTLLFELFPALIAKERENTLFRVHESIFSFGRTEDRVLEVSPKGRISLRVKSGMFAPGLGNHKSEAMLNAAEVHALRDFLASAAINDLQGSYVDADLGMDYHASMEIEINVLKESKRIALPNLGFSREHNSRIYPAPVQDLVCKIYGIEERVGIHYGHAVSIDLDKREHDDTWCNSAAMQLIPMAAP